MNYYIHIPFCKSKCKYCHFASFSWIDELQKNTYLSFLKKEINENLAKNTSKNTGSIYFWWWTPSILSLDEIKEILDIFKQISNNKEEIKLLDFSPVCGIEMTKGNSKWQNVEITLEANPEFITREYIEWLKNLWINRLSLWIQTLQNKSLEEIGRCNVEKIYKALDILQEAEFLNVWLDFIIWLPFVSKWGTKKDIENLLKKYTAIKHISVYMLEEWKYPESWEVNSLKDEELWQEYEEVAEFLEIKGFNRYELSNFSKTWFECKHNSWYWNHTEYTWFWLNAASFVGNRRFANSPNFIDYYTGKLDYEENLSTTDLELEKMMFDFRTIWVDIKFIKNNSKLEEFRLDLLIFQIWNIIKPTNKWVAIVDYLFKEIFL